MTLILTIQGREAIWLLADRRLSYKGRSPRDGAKKVLTLETTDGVALIGYAGLGATAAGTEPADWMARVLRGRNLSLEGSLQVLARATKEQLPRHLNQLSRDYGPAGHAALITAFVGNEVRCYSIGVGLGPHRVPFAPYTRYVNPDGRLPRIAVHGSGLAYLMKNQGWQRPLLNWIRSYDRGKIQGQAVANHLAKLNEEVYLGTRDGTVGPRCIIVWRNRQGGIHKGGGSHLCYTSCDQDRNTPLLPTIARGMDVSALAQKLMPYTQQRLSESLANGVAPEIDDEEIRRLIAGLSTQPDEHLE